MIRAEWLQVLSEANELGSFSAVAQRRGVSTVAVSKQIASLENYLGEPVFSRSTRPLSITEVGSVLLSKSTALLNEHQAITDWLDERHLKPAGVIKVFGLEERVLEFTLFPWIGEFCELYPEIKLEFDVVNDLHDLAQMRCDIYWGLGDPIGVLMPGLKRKRILETKFGIFAAPSYLKKHGIPETPADLKNHVMIGHTHNQPNNILIVKSGVDSIADFSGVSLKTQVVTSAGAIQLAQQGLGLINCAESLAELEGTVSSGSLAPVLESYWHEGAVAYAYFHQTRLEQPKIRAFLDFFTNKARKLSA